MIRAYIKTKDYETVMEIIDITYEDGYIEIGTTEVYNCNYRAKARSAYGMNERAELRKAAETGFYESELTFEEYREEEDDSTERNFSFYNSYDPSNN